MQPRIPLTRYLIEQQRAKNIIDDDLRVLIEVVSCFVVGAIAGL